MITKRDLLETISIQGDEILDIYARLDRIEAAIAPKRRGRPAGSANKAAKQPRTKDGKFAKKQ